MVAADRLTHAAAEPLTQLAEFHRMERALRKAFAWMAFNTSKQDPFAIDLARAVRCAQAARLEPITEDSDGQ
jgi:hypothetical protein